MLLFWKIPLGTIIKVPIYPSAGSRYRFVMIKNFVIYSFKNYIIFEAPPTGQPKNYAMEKRGYLG